MSTGTIEAILPLTPAQEGILFHSLLAPDVPLYFQQYVCTLVGDVDPDDLRRAWSVVIDRHAALRSLIAWRGREQPVQVVRASVDAEWLVEDVDGLDEAVVDARIEAFLDEDRRRGFDLERAPLMRFALFVGDRRHRFVWSHHHVVIDGWSMGIVLREVFEALTAITDGEEPDLPDPAPYRDYVRWLRSRDRSDDEPYWRRVLAGVTTPTSPAVERRTGGHDRWTERHDTRTVSLSIEATGRLTAFARRHGLTLGTVLAGAWALVLARHAGEDDVVFGTTVSGRPPEVAGATEMVGLFINTLPVRVDVRPDADLVEWLRAVQADRSEATAHEATPLPDVQAWSDVPAGESLFRTLLVVENVPHPPAGSGPVEVRDVHYLQRSNYPLAILAMPGDALEFTFLHDVDRYEPWAVDALARHLVHALEMIGRDAGHQVGDVDGLPPADVDVLAVGWQRGDGTIGNGATIHGLIDDVAARLPDAPAVVDANGVTTYRDLTERAEALARALAEFGAGPDARVLVAVPRSAGAVVAVLGALRSGAAYVPVDADAPPRRLAELAEGSGSLAVVAGEGVPTDGLGLPTLVVDGAGRLVTEAATGGPEPTPAGPDDLAYVMHTSGSTGTPKGVAVTHRSLVHSTRARLDAYGGPVSRFLLVSPLFFDSSLAGLFSTLTDGGTLVLPAPGMEQDVHHLARLIADNDVTHVLALPTLWELVLEHAEPESLASLEVVMVAGEACPPRVVHRTRERLPTVTLANEYGPSEATVWSTVHLMRPGDELPDPEGRVPIGCPIAGARVHVLDRHDRPSPIGVPGEITVGGPGLARGYVGDDRLTAERFPTLDPWGRGPERLYRTGDLGRWLPDGTLDVLGRLDDQVKLRGMRIEPGEIEAALVAHEGVRAAGVVVVGEGAGARLVAHVEGSVDADTVRRHAAERLPPAMVPTVVVHDHLPRGGTGKVDKTALSEVEVPSSVGDDDREPVGPVEATLARIWAEVLEVERVGVDDDFFDLGGDSILSIRILARAHEAGLEITPRQFFDHPTVAELAAVIDAD